MEYAFVRNRQNGTLFWEVPVSFQALPRTNEFIWLDISAFMVQAVSHTWSGGQPIVVLDVTPIDIHQEAGLFVRGNPI